MNVNRYLLACMGVLAGMAGPVRAATHVVDQAAPGAADTNSGTEAKPFKTVQHAANVAQPGDTVCVMAGKYDERVKVKAEGTEGKLVAFVALPRRAATVGGFDLDASYIRVEGFDLTAAKPAVAVQLGGSHCEVLDNYIHEMLMGVNGTYGRAVAGGPRDYSAVAHNRIAYNKVYLENNTFAGIPWCGVGLRGQESSNGQIRNNLFYDMQQAVLDGTKDDFTPANPVVEYNLAFKTAPLAMDKNINDKDPLLVNAEERNFRFRKGSPAAAAGKDGVTISGADLIEGWKREADGSWSAPLAAGPKKVLRDGQPWTEFSFDKAARRITVKPGGDPRLHVFETTVREQGIHLAGQKDVKMEEITVVDTLNEAK